MKLRPCLQNTPYTDLRQRGNPLLHQAVVQKIHFGNCISLDSLWSQRCSCGVKKSLLNRAESLFTHQEDLDITLQNNGYPLDFIIMRNKKLKHVMNCKKKNLYIQGLSEDIRRMSEITMYKQWPNIEKLFIQSEGQTTHKVKNKKYPKQSGVVYIVPCTRGKSYIGETKRSRLKEHRDACIDYDTTNSRNEHHPIAWEKILITQTQLNNLPTAN